MSISESISDSLIVKLGYAADPAPEILIMDKIKLAQLKIKKIDQYVKEMDTAINTINNHRETLLMERELLMKEYKIQQ